MSQLVGCKYACLRRKNTHSIKKKVHHMSIFFLFLSFYVSSYNLSHLSLNREGRWVTTDDFAASFLHFSLFFTALWDLTNSGPVHSLMLSFYLFLSALSSSSFHCALQDGFGHTTAVCVSLRRSGDLRVVRLPARSWHGLPRW